MPKATHLSAEGQLLVKNRVGLEDAIFVGRKTIQVQFVT
jgi:hypothetical protein